jgi:hypothetical protein
MVLGRSRRRIERVSSMPQLFNLILSIMVLMHTTFGCCVHHSHSAQIDCYQRCSDCCAASSNLTSDHAHQQEHRHPASPAEEYPWSQEEGCDGEVHILARTEVFPSELDDHFYRFGNWVTSEKYFQRGYTILLPGPLPAPDGKRPSGSTRSYLFLGVLLI